MADEDEDETVFVSRRFDSEHDLLPFRAAYMRSYQDHETLIFFYEGGVYFTTGDKKQALKILRRRAVG